MTSLDERKQFILHHLGQTFVDLLRTAGIDVDQALTSYLVRDEQADDQRNLQLVTNPVDSSMTSELAYLAKNPEDVFGQEYVRRIRLLGIPGDQIRGLFYQEALIASLSGLSEQRKQPWVKRRFISADSTSENLPKINELTLSELILITDDASSAYSRDHSWLSPEAWHAVCTAAVQWPKKAGGQTYAWAFKERVEKLGWSEEQHGAYTRNECMLTERLKWGYHNNPAWTSETANPTRYVR